MDFLDRLRNVYPSLQRGALEPYVAHDLVNGREVRVVLLCESPHNDEVRSSPPIPLVGQSGVSVAQALMAHVLGLETHGRDPVGRLISDGDPRFRWLGLMNVCRVPMQKDVYCRSVRDDYADLLSQLNKIRNRKEAVHLRCAVECAIKDDLKERWECVRTQHPSNILLVPCGRVARRFCRLAEISVPDGLKTPHPARAQWETGMEFCMTMDAIRAGVNGQAGDRTHALSRRSGSSRASGPGRWSPRS